MNKEITHGNLEFYVKEFCGIVKSVLRKNEGIVKGSFVYIGREELTVYLSKYDYESVENKLRFWRDLRWIVTDDEHFTTNIMIDRKRKRMVRISLSVHEILSKLLDNSPNSATPPVAPPDTPPKNENKQAIFGEKQQAFTPPITPPILSQEHESVNDVSKNNDLQQITPSTTPLTNANKFNLFEKREQPTTPPEKQEKKGFSFSVYKQ
jgi:hypothetical protein